MARGSHRVLAAGGVAAVMLVAGIGIASAAIPAQDGTITGCYNADGALSVVDAEAGVQCPSGSTQLTWNQQGPTGATGPQGPQGPAGTPGSVTKVWHEDLYGTPWSNQGGYKTVISASSAGHPYVTVVGGISLDPTHRWMLTVTGTASSAVQSSTCTGKLNINTLTTCVAPSNLYCTFVDNNSPQVPHGDFLTTVPAQGYASFAASMPTDAGVSSVDLRCGFQSGAGVYLSEFAVTATQL